MQAGADKGEGRSVRWGDVLLCAVAAVSWSLIGMAGTAALGLHLLGADSVGSLGPMTAATVALGVGGSVTPSGDVSAFGLDQTEATTAVDIAPLGVGLVGALLLAHFFLRSLRMAGVVISPAELIARAGAVIALFLAMLAGLVWAGHDVVTIDGERLGLDKELDEELDKGIEEGLDRLPGGIGDKLPDGLGDIGDVGDIGGIGGLLPDRLGDLAQAKASVGFTVDTAPTLLGGTVWAAGVLLIALLASRRTPLPRGLGALHRVVRPAASALVTVALVAVAAGFAAAAYAMTGDDHPRRIAGAALLGAPNGVWLGVPVGLFVPWDGSATGVLTRFLPDPVDDLLSGSSERALTLGRLAELDGRVWLMGVAAALMMLFAGVLAAVRTPVAREASARTAGALGFAGRCGVRLGAATAVGLPLLVWLTGVSADASLSVFGIDAFGAGIELHGRVGAAALLGAAWGFGAGAAGAALAYATGAAGGRASGSGAGSGDPKAADEAAAGRDEAGAARDEAGPYRPSAPHRPPNPDTNPYLRPPPDVSSAPTVVGPIVPPPRPRPEQTRPRPRPGDWPPPPPPPPPPPKAPRGPR
ncbi:streptophobe family protein [Streptomyces sp. NPDC018584]|uniref:streptophobe family protein n=1 Tax=unclassified Streptomyces TaxID=2593676 RepID=UPI00378A1CC5